MVASLGGISAFSTVLAGLPADFPLPIVVVQHRARLSPGHHDVLVDVLARCSALPVRSVTAGACADEQGVAVIAGRTTATIDAARKWVLNDAADANVGDALLVSSADHAPTIAVVLTGYQTDGSDGVRAVKRGGGRVLVQDPATARAASMPSHAIATGCVDFVLPLHQLWAALVALAVGPGAADLLTVPLPPWARLAPVTPFACSCGAVDAATAASAIAARPMGPRRPLRDGHVGTGDPAAYCRSHAHSADMFSDIGSPSQRKR
ncbi:chemotaxis protein CheB [Mycobacterium intracellulare]|uniref:protein-glutamate methylesterase n=1 Tax=Mycobacterium intracellulare TaxID=1767 RepID=A0AAE4UFB6_MYCIT|nr:chemotaxis protein CheB [Mycobacterium intracellulare]MDV6979289.1 chemotaxis protein CheB [Mycobacterium intracellulare]MDV6984744.1 chemotaxis protein CheB [Mycobacterium intracellulare]MDV7014848.1 chemotaxis protein CheB [Mycobacterium intracellulare]MDV7031015.1 chemotaxis protein CheB [Mycobacterium intracellulare]